MNKVLFIVFTMILFQLTFAQDVDVIIKKNIFDPKRGTEEKVENTDTEIVKEELPKDMPILDGIMTVGKYKKAIFRYKDDKTRKLVSINVSEGEKVGDATVKEISKDFVIVYFNGKSYKVNVDSKYDLGNSPKHSGTNYTSAPSSVAVTETKTKSQPTGRTVKPVKPSSKEKAKGKGQSTPFGTAKKSSTDKPKRKVHPF